MTYRPLFINVAEDPERALWEDNPQQDHLIRWRHDMEITEKKMRLMHLEWRAQRWDRQLSREHHEELVALRAYLKDR